MPFKPDDPTLAGICKDSSTLQFRPPIAAFKQTSMHHVYCLPAITRRPYVVKFSIGGRVRTLGFFSTRETACRFADMVTLRFWKYRRRNTPQRFNFSQEQALEDTNTNEEAAYMLAQIENHLSAHLTEYINRTPIPRKKKLSWSDRVATLRADIANLESRIAVLESKSMQPVFDIIEKPTTTQPVTLWQTKPK